MSSDEKKHDLNQAFKAWDLEHREPASPESEEKTYVLSDAERKFMRDQARFHRIASETLKAFGNKARQKAYAAENAAIEAELDAAEAGQARGGREKATASIPQQSLESDPKPRIPAEKINVDAIPAPNGVSVANDDKERKRIAAMNKVNDPKMHPFLRLDEAAAVLGLDSTRAVQKRISNKKDPLEQGPRDGTVSTNSVRKALRI